MRYFLSYSRQQLYFAEIFVKHLQHYEVETWFDLRQLNPGCNWLEEIDNGLASCDGLILLASPSAMASPYVEKEWRTMLETGRPVYVVYRETARLSTDLQSLPIYDMRVYHPVDASRFADYLKGKSKAKAVSGIGGIWRRFALPRDLWLIILSLVAPIYFAFQQWEAICIQSYPLQMSWSYR